MKKMSIWLVLIAIVSVSCGTGSYVKDDERVITVTIPPFAWFVENIAGGDFIVNVLLPPGADHHIWEPLPAQINSLSGSEAFIMNGQLTFEHAWMDRFMQVNPGMKVLDLSANIQLIGHEDGVDDDEGHAQDNEGDDHSKGDHAHADNCHAQTDAEHAHTDNEHAHGGTDPHYWMSPVAARIMAQDIRDFLVELNPDSAAKYSANLIAVNRKISQADSLLREALASNPQGTVLIYHPALAYMGRDYGFEQVSFEDEGKNPSPARMKELIDLARDKKIKTIFIQAEYDVRNAESLSRETGARLVVINPMNPDWPEAVMEVARAVGSTGWQ
jgi:zinc transport system substrate-binding protein